MTTPTALTRPRALRALQGRAKTPQIAPWAEASLLLLLLLGSAFLRLYRLESVPPGMFVDVATNGLDIRDVLAGHLPVFFARNYGREALFIYFQALLVAGAGTRPVVFTFSAVVMSMLTIPLSYRLFKAMFGWRVGFIAAALLSTSFWYVDLGRFGLRSMSLPPLLVATLYCLWRTVRTGRRRYAVLGGLALGLSLYTYISSRLVPFLVVLMWLVDLPRTRRNWRQLALLVVVSLAVFAPEGVYFWQHRQEMALRAGQVSVFNPAPEVEGSHDTPLESFLNTAGMFFIRGDENQRHNLPHRPVFDPWLAAFFAAGLALAVWRSRSDVRYRWALLWLVVMCLPSALSHESPSMFRTVSVAPVTFLFPAIAFDGLITVLAAWHLGELMAAAAIVASGAVTFNLYFGQWAHDPKTYWAYDGNLPQVADFVQARPETVMYFGVDHRSTIEFLTPKSQAGRWYREESAAIPVPAAAADVLYISAPTAALKDAAPPALPGLEALPHTNDPAGQPDFYAFRWPAAAVSTFLANRQPVNAGMAPDFQLTAYELVRSGNQQALDLFWQPLQPSGPYDLFVHVLDGAGKQVAQSDRLAWPIDEGPFREDLLLTQHTFNLPPGSYVVEVGAVHRSIQDRGQLVGPPIGQVARIPISIPPAQ